MNDLINRKDAIDAINTHFGFNIDEEYGSAVQEVINGLPSAQPERKKGKWTVTSLFIKCSECGEAFILIPQNYCPNCGADMKGSDDEYEETVGV